MGIQTKGTLRHVFPTVKVSERFTKREFVVELADNPKYPQPVLFQLSGDRCNQLDNLRPGSTVRLDFSLRGREWKSPKGEVKYFNSLDVWSVEIEGPAPPLPSDEPGWVRENQGGYGAPPDEGGGY